MSVIFSSLTASMPREELKQMAQSLNARKKKILEKIKSDPQQMSTSVFLEQYKFSCEIQESRAIQKAEDVSARTTSKRVQYRGGSEDPVDGTPVRDNCNPSAPIRRSHEEDNRLYSHKDDDAEEDGFICTTAELDIRLSFLEDFWDVVSIDEFAAFIRGLFERCSL